MQDSLATMLVVGGVVSVAATIPQALMLIKVKRTEELSLPSWVIWFIYQLVSVSYSYSIKAYLYMTINAMWAVFYAVMIYLIVKYRRNPGEPQTKLQAESYCE